MISHGPAERQINLRLVLLRSLWLEVRGQRSGVPAQVTDQSDVVGGVSHAGQSLVGGDLLMAGQRDHLLHLHTNMFLFRENWTPVLPNQLFLIHLDQSLDFG